MKKYLPTELIKALRSSRRRSYNEILQQIYSNLLYALMVSWFIQIGHFFTSFSFRWAPSLFVTTYSTRFWTRGSWSCCSTQRWSRFSRSIGWNRRREAEPCPTAEIRFWIEFVYVFVCSGDFERFIKLLHGLADKSLIVNRPKWLSVESITRYGINWPLSRLVYTNLTSSGGTLHLFMIWQRTAGSKALGK